MTKPWDPNEFGGSSGAKPWDPNEFSGPSSSQEWDSDEFSGKPKQKKAAPEGSKKGSLKEQVHDIASAGTAAADLVTMLPGMIGGALSWAQRVGPDQERMAGRKVEKPAQELLESIGQGGEATTMSNALGIQDHQDRPGYRAVMRPVEAVTEAMHLGGQGVKKAAEAGWLGTDRANTAQASELGAGTEVGAMAALPFLHRAPARPGSGRAYSETFQRRPGEPEIAESAINRDSYPPEKPAEPVKPWDANEFKSPIPDEFTPEYRPEQLMEGEGTLTPDVGTIRTRPERDMQDSYGLAPETLVERQNLDILREEHGQRPVEALSGRGARDDVLPQPPTDPLQFHRYDPNRIADQVAATEKPGFLRSAEEVMRARELEKAERDRSKALDARLEDQNWTQFDNPRLASVVLSKIDEMKPGSNIVRTGLMEIQRNSDVPWYRELSKKLLEDPEFKPAFDNDMKKRGTPAHYDYNTHTISIDHRYVGNEQLLMHESMHARVAAPIEGMRALREMEKLNGGKPVPRHAFHSRFKGAERSARRIFDLYEDLHARMGSVDVLEHPNHPLNRIADRYGMKDVQEFVSEGFTNPAFQADLAQLKLPKHLREKSLQNYWDSFVDAIRGMFGLNPKYNTYLSELLRNGAELMDNTKSLQRLNYAFALKESGRDAYFGAPPLKELKRRGGPVQALAEEAREMSLDQRPIEKVIEDIAAGKIEDFTAKHSNALMQVVARLGSLVKENLLMDTSIRQLMKDKPGSGQLIKWTIDQVARIERKMITATKQAVNAGLTDLRKMYRSPSGRIELVQMWDKWQEFIGVRDLTRADFASDRQWNVYSKMRAIDDKILNDVNAMRIEAGLDPIDRLPSHFRGMWEGDYRVFIYDNAGNKKAAYGFDTEWGAKKFSEEWNKKRPDMKADYDHVKTDPSGIRNLQAFEDAIRIMSEKNDPVVKAIQQTYNEILQHRGFGRTGIHRKNIGGSMGTEGGIKGLRQMERAFEQHVNQAYRYIGNLEKQRVLADLQKVPMELRNKMPQTFEFLQNYIRKAQGKKLENRFDAAVESLSKALGLGEHGPQTAIREMSAIATIYWLTTPRFLISQSVQSLNAVPKLVQKYGQIDAAKAYFTGIKNTIAPDAIAKEAVAWASEKGYLDATIRNLIGKELNERPIGGKLEPIKEVASLPAAWIEHNMVRAPVYLAFESALRPYIKDKKARFHEAANYADYYMVNYGRTHGAQVYDKMGLVGEAARPLKQYAHNTFGQFFEYARNVKTKGEVAPLAYFLGVQASVAGLKGTMLIAEATAVITLLNYMFDLDVPTPEQLMLKHGLHDVLIYGGLSTILQHDVSASVSAPGIPNMFTAAPIQFNLRLAQDVGTYLLHLAKGEETDQDRLKALLALTPNLMHEWIKLQFTEESGTTPNPNDPNLRGNYRRSGEQTEFMGLQWPTSGEKLSSSTLFVAKPLAEAKIDAMMRAAKQELQRDLVRRQNALEAITDRVMNGQNIDESLVQKYVEQGGDPKNLQKLIMNKMKERMMTGPERMQQFRQLTPGTMHRLETLHDYLEELHNGLPEGYRWDPETGEIKPLSYMMKGEPEGVQLASLTEDQAKSMVKGRVLSDSNPPSSWTRVLPKTITNSTDLRMQIGNPNRTGSEYTMPQLDADEHTKEVLEQVRTKLPPLKRKRM